jgi:uncharacterized protein (TIGR04551 family)
MFGGNSVRGSRALPILTLLSSLGGAAASEGMAFAQGTAAPAPGTRAGGGRPTGSTTGQSGQTGSAAPSTGSAPSPDTSAMAPSTTPPATGAGTSPAGAGSPSTAPSLMPPGDQAAQGGQAAPGATTGAGAPAGYVPVPPPVAPAAPRAVTMTPIDPAGDQRQLVVLGDARPSDADAVGSRPDQVYSEDWWGHTRPLLEIHGYFRTRGEVYHNFTLGRHDGPSTGVYNQNLWKQPLDQSYGDTSGTEHAVALCSNSPTFTNCIDKTQSSANLRFRVNPELHISDNLRILSQIDMLDNLVLGSTPDSYATTASGVAGSGNPNAPLGFFSTTQGSPTAGVNGTQNSINVNRVWAEYMTPVGQLRFGRMPDQFGLGMVHNSGDGIDSDYQSTVDRIMFTTGLKSLDLYLAGTWDFVSTGATNQTPYSVYGGELYNTANLTNVNQWSVILVRKKNPEMTRLALARNEFVVNGGIYVSYRSQDLDVASTTGTNVSGVPYSSDFVNANNNSTSTIANNDLERRGAYEYTPDLWFQVLFQKFRFEAEFASYIGAIENAPSNNSTNIAATKIREYGLTTQTEFKAIEDKLHLNFGFGWASGDPWRQTLAPGNTVPAELNGGHGPISEFSFHPDYRVDLIFFRNILSRVEGAYYFRPSVDYDFLKDQNGQKLGGGAAIIWSRATDFEQTPGHARDLGVELDASVYYQAKDGTLNDDPAKLGGFFAMLQYGVFFPLGGLSYLPGQTASTSLPNWDTSTAQTVRLFLGVVY